MSPTRVYDVPTSPVSMASTCRATAWISGSAIALPYRQAPDDHVAQVPSCATVATQKCGHQRRVPG
jgi:hypothetical protein